MFLIFLRSTVDSTAKPCIASEMFDPRFFDGKRVIGTPIPVPEHMESLPLDVIVQELTKLVCSDEVPAQPGDAFPQEMDP